MSEFVSIKINEDLIKSLEKFEKETREKILISATAASAKVIYEDVLINVPVKTGLLKSSIYRTFSKEKSSYEVATYRISWNHKIAPHGHLIEFGTSKSPAKPFVSPAMDKMPDAINAGIERMIERLEK
jgi:HK97 gp10 family phage protein